MTETFAYLGNFEISNFSVAEVNHSAKLHFEVHGVRVKNVLEEEGIDISFVPDLMRH